MLNVSNQKVIDYSGAKNFGSALGVGELVNKNIIKDAVDSFTYKSIKGKAYTDPKLSPGRVIQVIYIEENGFYKLSLAIIPLKKGTYILSTTDMPDVIKNWYRRSWRK